MSTITQNEQKEKLEEKMSEPYTLILHNDDYNTFDHVISCLVRICDHSHDQAEQCAHFVHWKGKCDVKRGDKETIEELCEKLKFEKLSATCEAS